MTTRRKHRRSYLETLESILKACPGVRTTLYVRAGIPWAVFHGSDYLPLLLRQGLVVVDKDPKHSHSVYKNIDTYTLTSKGERYLHLIAEARKILGVE